MGYTSCKELEVLTNIFSLYIVPLHFPQCMLRFLGTLSHDMYVFTTLPSHTTLQSHWHSLDFLNRLWPFSPLRLLTCFFLCQEAVQNIQDSLQVAKPQFKLNSAWLQQTNKKGKLIRTFPWKLQELMASGIAGSRNLNDVIRMLYFYQLHWCHSQSRFPL